jgi:hypothetical protein
MRARSRTSSKRQRRTMRPSRKTSNRARGGPASGTASIGQVPEGLACIDLPWSDFISFGGTISAGSSEIQRNIIAEKVLGLPRG